MYSNIVPPFKSLLVTVTDLLRQRGVFGRIPCAEAHQQEAGRVEQALFVQPSLSAAPP